MSFSFGVSIALPLIIYAQGPGATASTPHDDPVLRAVVQLVAVGPRGSDGTLQCTASGFLIDEDGYLITNAHVVDEARKCLQKAPGAKILLKLSGGSSRAAQGVPADVVALDDANDLALLKAERPLVYNPGEKTPFADLDARHVQAGVTVRVSGHPAATWQAITQMGEVIWAGKTRLEEINDPRTDVSDAVEMNIRLQPGSSGSPVYSSVGVIGVVDKRDVTRPDYSIAVAIHYVIELAERNHAPWHAGN